jgi:hypothetical protein
MRLQVVIGDRRIVVPVKDGLTTKDLLDETRRRTGLSPDAGDTIVTAGGFELYMEDQVIAYNLDGNTQFSVISIPATLHFQVADVLNDGETVHVVTPNQLLACMTTGMPNTLLTMCCASRDTHPRICLHRPFSLAASGASAEC